MIINFIVGYVHPLIILTKNMKLPTDIILFHLLFDSTKDINNHSVAVICLQTSSKVNVIATPIVVIEMKTKEWVTKSLSSIVKSKSKKNYLQLSFAPEIQDLINVACCFWCSIKL